MTPRKFGLDDEDYDDVLEWTEDDDSDRRREAARKWDETNQKIAKVALGWVVGDGPYYVNEKTKAPTGWYTKHSAGKKFEPTRKLSHAIGAAEAIAIRLRALPFTLKCDGQSGWEARFPHRPHDTVCVELSPERAVWKAVLKADREIVDPESLFRGRSADH